VSKLVLYLFTALLLSAEPKVEKNIVYGMVSGLALLMDVHYPEKPNGRGVVFVAGSGWQARGIYSAPALKEQQIGDWGPALLSAGYTVFAINHRASPRFHFPAPLEDVQRAVRYIRHNAAQYSIDPNKLGGLGGSSGGHLIGLTAMMAAKGITGDPDPVNRQPATLQCVVLRAAPSDLAKMIGGSTLGTAAVVSFLERVPMSPEDQATYRAASPVTHIKVGGSPVLLIHGDADDTVPFQQSVAFEAELQAAQVPVKLVRIPGGAHGSDFGRNGKPHEAFPQAKSEAIAWLTLHL